MGTSKTFMTYFSAQFQIMGSTQKFFVVLLQNKVDEMQSFDKVHIFWEGQIILENLHHRFDCYIHRTNLRWWYRKNFMAFSKNLNYYSYLTVTIQGKVLLDIDFETLFFENYFQNQLLPFCDYIWIFKFYTHY